MKRYVSVFFTLLIFIPIFIGLGYLYYYIFTVAELHWFFRVLIVVLTVSLVGAFIKAGIDRMKEIREGVEDDLGKY